jgi:hypothetical protein
MKRLILLLMILKETIAFAQPNVIPLGVLERFWRNHPVLGPHLQDGIWLNKVPDYFFDTDFPYKLRPYEKEVLFADHLSVVRLLGGTDNYPELKLKLTSGVNPDGTMKQSKLSVSDTAAIRKLAQYDFVYRNTDNTLGFRPELIRQRLAPYLDNGYESFTLVLDNVPWGLRKEAIIGGFGQVGPPDDPEEWYITVKELCKTLKDIMGEKKANGLRFRIGTEMNGKERFDGTEDRFITHFDFAAAAIADVLPGARISLFNISSVSIDNIEKNHNVNAFHVIEHASAGINRKSGKPNIPMPYIAASRYYCEKNDLNTIVNGIDETWDFIKENIPGNENFTREIHEYGAIADWDAKPTTNNPDAFGNAMNLQMMINLYSNGLDRLFHWNMLEKVSVPDRQPIMLPNGQLWGYSVLEYMAGGESFYICPKITDKKSETTYTALLSVFDDKAYLLVNAFNSDRNDHAEQTINLEIPKKTIPFPIGLIKSATCNNSNSIYYNMRKDMEKKGVLNPMIADKPEYITELKNLTDNLNRGQSIIAENWERYKSMWKSSLILKQFNGTIEEHGDSYLISLKMTAPESTVIVINNKIINK